MSQNQEWYIILLDAAKHRGIKLPEDDLNQLDEKEAVKLSAWVEQNLKYPEPLTVEEATIWRHICGKKSQQYEEDADDAILPVPQDERQLQQAIDDIQMSTQNLRHKSRTLEEQRRVKLDLENRPKSAYLENTFTEATLERQQLAEKQQAFFLKDEAETELHEKIRVFQEKTEKSVRAVGFNVQEKLKMDDRTLNSLEETLSHQQLNTYERRLESQHLLQALQQAIIMSLKIRLDRIYLQGIQSQDHRNELDGNSELLQQTQADLQSLYAEIDVVASMLVDNTYGSRVKKVEGDLDRLVIEDASQKATKVANKLKELTESTDEFAGHLRQLHAHRYLYATLNEQLLQMQKTDSLEVSSNRSCPTMNSNALLRHLGVDESELNDGSDIVERLYMQSDKLLKENQKITDRIVAEIDNLITGNAQSLQKFLPTANKYLMETVQQSKELDDQIALAKAKYEKASNATDPNVYTRMNFVSDYSRET